MFEMTSPVLKEIGPSEAYAANYVCGQDLNGDGFVDTQGETANCVSTPQGQLCPVSAVNCSSSQSCPLGNYPCINGSCTQAGVCSSVNIPITQYQCPSSGTIYNDSVACNNNCTPWAYCNANPYTYSVPAGVSLSYQGSLFGNPIGIYGLSIWGSGSTLYFDTYTINTDGWEVFSQRVAATVSGASFSGSAYAHSGTWSGFFSNNGSSLCDYTGSCVNVYGVYMSTNMGGTEWQRQYNIATNGSGYLYISPWGDNSTYIYFYTNATDYSYSCPLGGYSCVGSPPYCVAPQSCVTYNSSITKYQCSLTGTNYDTQSQCTSSCFNTSTCSTNYSCPLGGRYTCMNNSGTYQCSPNQCQDLDVTPAVITKNDDTMLQDDGPRDADGNCLGQIYLFTGRGMRCRPSGYSTGFGNCCAKSQGAMKDGIGNAASTFNGIKNTIAGVKTAYDIVNVGSVAARVGGSPNYFVNLTRDPSTKVITKADIIQNSPVTDMEIGTQTFTGNSAKSFENIKPGMGSDAAATASIQNYAAQIGPQVALAAVTMAIKDPTLSSAVNLVGQVILGAGPIGIGLAVVSLAMSIFTVKCDQQDIETSTLNDSKYCHYVGDYCDKKWPLVGCVQKAKGYCCFNSKLGRIIHEKGRSQLKIFQPNGAWGSGKGPNCRGFTPEEFQMLDFGKMDMSEYFNDLQTKAVETIQQNATDKVQQYYQNIR